MTVGELYSFLCEKIPSTLSCDWDHDGLAVCPDRNAPVSGVVCVLDMSEAALDLAIEKGCNVIFTHHPMLFRPLASLSGDTPLEKLAIRCLLCGVSVMGFHTRADAVEGGTNTCLLASLGLKVVPEVCDGQVFRLGTLPSPMTAHEFARHIKEKLGASVRYADGGKPITTVLVCGGGGKGFSAEAQHLGADAFLTGEIGHHGLCDAPAIGISLFEAGHFETEVAVLNFFASLVSEADSHIPVFPSTLTDLHCI